MRFSRIATPIETEATTLAKIAAPNDEVERRALTANEDALSRSFDSLVCSPKLPGRSNRLLDGRDRLAKT